MTDSPIPATFHRPVIRRLRLPVPGRHAGPILSALVRTVAEAAAMAYVAPFTGAAHRPQLRGGDDLNGRDPDW